jgi:transcriptional regulator with XRE-family HTH domain
MVAKRELTQAERECAERLRRIWERKRQALELTQEKVAYACGWTTQGAFGHYLQGKNPLNIDAVFKLARVLEVDPREIMPELHEILMEFFPEIGGVGDSRLLSEEVLRVALAMQALPSKDRASLQKIVDALAQQVKGVDRAEGG